MSASFATRSATSRPCFSRKLLASMSDTLAKCYSNVNSILRVPPPSRLLSNFGMDSKGARRANLVALVSEFGSVQALADRAEIAATHLRNVINNQDGRELGDKLARRIEDKLNKPHGWMDAPHEEVPASWAALIRTLESLEESKRPIVIEAITTALNPPVRKPAYSSGTSKKGLPADIKKNHKTAG